MSAPDIGTLRGIRDRLLAARRACDAVRVIMNAAENAALVADFGPARDDRTRRYQTDGAFVFVAFVTMDGVWEATAAAKSNWEQQRHITTADSPRSAVDQALAALRLTHPVEADALAAVVPGVPSV